jgi:hypothetical protein
MDIFINQYISYESTNLASPNLGLHWGCFLSIRPNLGIEPEGF